MRTSFTNARSSGQRFIPFWLIIFTLVGHGAMSQATVTYTTEPLAAGNVLQGTNDRVCYVLKITPGGTGSVTISSLSINTSGTYTNTDIGQFKVWGSATMPSLANATHIGTSASVTGNGETLSFSLNSVLTFGAGNVAYLLITADVQAAATAGRTFGIDGANNSLIINYLGNAPAVTNSQSNAAGLQTIVSPTVTYTTVGLAAESVVPGATDRLLYVLKVEAGNPGSVSFTNLAINTSGTYTASDISQFKLWRNNTPTLTGATSAAVDGSLTGNGETLSFASVQNIAASATAYFLITADVQAGATIDRTFGINGASNALNITYSGILPAVTNSQTNASGLKTIVLASVTYSTEPVASSIVTKNTERNLTYILKVVVGSSLALPLNKFIINTIGTYTNADLYYFVLYRNTSPTLTGATVTGLFQLTPGNIAPASFSLSPGTINLPAGSTTYFLIAATVKPGATDGRSYGIDGSNNSLDIGYTNIAPAIENNQTNVAGLQYIAQLPLPVTLVSFAAKTEGSVRQLSWETSMEKDNDYFEIQRSTDAKNFSAIAQVKGSAAGFAMHRYEYTDESAVQAGSIIYYRLKMVDLDGTYAYSSIVSCRDVNPQTLQAAVFPNPFSTYVKVKYLAGETVTFSWVSSDGRLVGTPEKRLIPSSGESLIMGLDKLAPGTYFLTISSAAGTVTQKIVKE